MSLACAGAAARTSRTKVSVRGRTRVRSTSARASLKYGAPAWLTVQVPCSGGDGVDRAQRDRVVVELLPPAAGQLEVGELLQRAPQRADVGAPRLADPAIGLPRRLDRLLDLGRRLALLEALGDLQHLAHP